MELLLWRWSTVVQAGSSLLIALFFVAIAHGMRRAELRAWVWAWLVNLAALLVTVTYYIVQPDDPWVTRVLTATYFATKLGFAYLLFRGADAFRGGRLSTVRGEYIVAALVAGGIASTLVTDSINLRGAIVCVLLWLGMGWTAIYLARARAADHIWLITGLGLRSVLALIEAVAFVALHIRLENDLPVHETLQTFITVQSSFDAVAEWMIALGCVLTLYGTIRREITAANTNLNAAQVQLQDLLNRDQLTGLLNRRVLPTVFREASDNGATVLFFDLDQFKTINDGHGHQVGDNCLIRFARTLGDNFTSGDRVIRYAGDEFVVITQDTSPETIARRIDAIDHALRHEGDDGVCIRFSHGQATLPAGGDPEVALKAADHAMYKAKAARA